MHNQNINQLFYSIANGNKLLSLLNKCVQPSPHQPPQRNYLHRQDYTNTISPQENLSSVQSFRSCKFRARMVIGNFKNSRGHLEAYTTIVQNDHIRPILGLITIPIVINVEPVFLIRTWPCHIALWCTLTYAKFDSVALLVMLKLNLIIKSFFWVSSSSC